MPSEPRTTVDRVRVVAAVLCKQGGKIPCVFCHSATVADCVAWGDYIDEAAEIVAALDQKEHTHGLLGRPCG